MASPLFVVSFMCLILFLLNFFEMLNCFHFFTQYTRRVYDISWKDVLLGLAMQVFAYMVNAELFVSQDIELMLWF